MCFDTFLEVLVDSNVSTVLVLVGQVLLVAPELGFCIFAYPSMKVRDGQYFRHPAYVFSGCTLKSSHATHLEDTRVLDCGGSCKVVRQC